MHVFVVWADDADGPQIQAVFRTESEAHRFRQRCTAANPRFVQVPVAGSATAPDTLYAVQSDTAVLYDDPDVAAIAAGPGGRVTPFALRMFVGDR